MYSVIPATTQYPYTAWFFDKKADNNLVSYVVTHIYTNVEDLEKPLILPIILYKGQFTRIPKELKDDFLGITTSVLPKVAEEQFGDMIRHKLVELEPQKPESKDTVRVLPKGSRRR